MNYDDILDILTSDNYHVIKKDILKLVNDSVFIDKIIHIKNPMIFDRFMKMCEFKIDTGIIYEERNEYIEKVINKLNNDNIYKFFELENLEKSRQEVIANRYLIEYIVCYYFQDNYYNFLVNFNQMTSYLNRCDEIVSSDNINLYKEFLKLRETNIMDKINLFNSHLGDDLMSMFYDDLNKVREDSHKKLVDYSLKLNKNNDIYQEELSNKYGVDVYYLDGEEFYGFTRCLVIDKSDNKDNSDAVYSRGRRLGYSFSYISNHNLGMINYDAKTVLLYYDNIDYKNIMYVHHADMSSGKIEKLDRYISEKENEIMTPSGLIANTKNYNEIYIKANIDGIKPTALICNDYVKEEDIIFAKQYNLSILIINTKKYKIYHDFNDDYDSYTYVI